MPGCGGKTAQAAAELSAPATDHFRTQLQLSRHVRQTTTALPGGLFFRLDSTASSPEP